MTQRSEDALIALRQIQRRTEQASKRLAQMVNLTPSQLLVLEILSEQGETSVGEISALTQLKHATITSLIDKLVANGLVARRRCDEDRRRVWVALEAAGKRALKSAPDLLQGTFEAGFSKLPDWHQAMLVSSLERVVALLNATDIDAAPVLHIGALDEKPS